MKAAGRVLLLTFLQVIGLVQSTGWNVVAKRDTFIEWDLEEFPLQIKTDSAEGSNDLLSIFFYPEDSASTLRHLSLGYLNINFATLSIEVGYCAGKAAVTKAIPKGTSKIWTISKSSTDLTVDCNNVRVIYLQFASDEKADCKLKWSQDAVKMSVYYKDTATDGYRNAIVVDGGYSAWSAWTTCTVLCGAGEETRSRTCTNPPPAYGGVNCVGENTETRDCYNTQGCPVDGGYSAWSAWTTCSAACGGGEETRSRTCTNPAPANGGVDCVGENTEIRECNTQGCPVDGGYSEWSAWTTCSAACGGETTRSRNCTNPAPANGGVDCVGESTETRECNTQGCPEENNDSSGDDHDCEKNETCYSDANSVVAAAFMVTVSLLTQLF